MHLLRGRVHALGVLQKPHTTRYYEGLGVVKNALIAIGAVHPVCAHRNTVHTSTPGACACAGGFLLFLLWGYYGSGVREKLV